MPAWTPPEKTKPIDLRAYAVLRALIETGVILAAVYDQAIANGCTDNCLPQTTPSVTLMADLLYEYVPAAYIPLAMGLDDSDRTSIATFQPGRQVLLDALDKAAGPGVLGKIESFPGADTATGRGPLWWAEALKTGPLKSLGQQLWRDRKVSRTVSDHAGMTDVLLESPIVEAAAATLAALDGRADALQRGDAAADRLHKLGAWSFVDYTVYINKTPADRLQVWKSGQPVHGLNYSKSAKQIVKELYETWYGAALLPGAAAYPYFKAWDEGGLSLPDLPDLGIAKAIERALTTLAIVVGVSAAGYMIFKIATKPSATVSISRR